MTKKILTAIILLASFAAADMTSTIADSHGNICVAAAPNNGTYMRTSSSVSVYSESGHPKGSFAVYLHKGKRYIDFNNTWICIQGKKRFAYRGNWYVIK